MIAFLDHVVLICADLSRTSAWIGEQTGVAPTYGGRHSTGDTHNALLGLGATCYLEILAPTGPAAPGEHEWARLARAASEPRVLTYCVRAVQPLPQLARAITARGWREPQIIDGARIRPDGSTLHWRVLMCAANPFGFAFPFFIDWLGEAHPAESLQALEGGAEVRLDDFSVGHPQARALAKVLADVGQLAVTYPADTTEFRVTLETSRGVVMLPST